MDCRRVASLICFCAAVVPEFALAGQDLQPISDHSQRIEIPGVSVLPPQGENWFLFSEDVPEGSLIRFIQRVRVLPPSRAEDAREVLAGVAILDSEQVGSQTAAEFLEDFKGDIRIGEMITSRQRLIGLEAILADSAEATCVRYNRLTEITGQFPAFPALVAITSTRGLYCAHPNWPEYHIDVTYQQIYAKGQAPLPRDAEADAFLKSVVFTSSRRPVAEPGTQAFYASHMQAAEAAYRERRWSDAETSLQAALKLAERFGPTNPLVAMTLYYLGSLQYAQDRPVDAERFFRRALDLFEAQSGVDDPAVAQLHGMTLNDLGAIYGNQASEATSPSAKQFQLEEAGRLYRRALAIREKSDPSQVGRTLSNLTQVYIDLGRWSDAAAAGQRAASFYEQQRGPNDLEVVYQLDRLADIYLQQERLAEAEPVIERVVSDMQRILGHNHPAIARRLESYAASLRKAGRDAEARELEIRAKAIRDNAPGRP